MWWPRKPEPVLNWRLVKFVTPCLDCGAEVETAIPMLVIRCERCHEGLKFVDSLPYSVQDRYLNDLEYDLDS